MKRLRIGIALALLLLPLPMPVLAEGAESVTPALIITELKVRNDIVGFNEFIEIHNPGDNPVNLQEYYVEYLNKSLVGPDDEPTKAIIAEGILPVNASIVLAKDKTQIPESFASPFSSLLDSAGLIRLTNLGGEVIDQLAWNSSATQAVSPIVHVPTTSSTKSIQRSKDEDDKWVIMPVTWELAVPTPSSVILLPLPEPEPVPEELEPTPPIEELPIEEPANQENVESTTDVEITPEETSAVTLLPLQIIELLPNPKSPETDNNDEYVELFNPNPEPIDLKGYKVQTGNNYSYSHIFTEGTIPANGYFIVTSGGSSLALANTSGRARLLDPNGIVVMETAGYEEANEGDAWALIINSWQWTTTPTRLGANILTLPVAKVEAAATVISPNKKTPKPKVATQPKVKTAVAKKASSSKTTTKKQPKPKKQETIAAAVPENIDSPPPLHPAVLAGVSGLAVLYAGYEYRHDVANRIYSFRSYRAARRAARAASAGR